MPTYQYACTECGNQLEAVQSFTDAALTECPVCQGRLRKVFGSVGVVFKGSGFYRTDSRNGSSATAPAASTNGEKSTSSSDSSSTSTTSSSTPASSSSSSSSSGSGSSTATAASSSKSSSPSAA